MAIKVFCEGCKRAYNMRNHFAAIPCMRLWILSLAFMASFSLIVGCGSNTKPEVAMPIEPAGADPKPEDAKPIEPGRTASETKTRSQNSVRILDNPDNIPISALLVPIAEVSQLGDFRDGLNPNTSQFRPNSYRDSCRALVIEWTTSNRDSFADAYRLPSISGEKCHPGFLAGKFDYDLTGKSDYYPVPALAFDKMEAGPLPIVCVIEGGPGGTVRSGFIQGGGVLKMFWPLPNECASVTFELPGRKPIRMECSPGSISKKSDPTSGNGGDVQPSHISVARIPASGTQPRRLEYKPRNDDEKKKWDALVALLKGGEPKDLLDQMNGQSGPLMSHIQHFMAPWFVDLGDKDVTYSCVPAACLDMSIGAVWVEPRAEGKATATAPLIEPNWAATPIQGMSGWLRNTEGKNVHFISQRRLIIVPDNATPGPQALSISVEANGPPDEKGNGQFKVRKEFKLNIESWPTPDREAMLCFWAYSIMQGKGVTEQKKRDPNTDVQHLLWCRNIFEFGFQQIVDSSLAELHRELLTSDDYQSYVAGNLPPANGGIQLAKPTPRSETATVGKVTDEMIGTWNSESIQLTVSADGKTDCLIDLGGIGIRQQSEVIKFGKKYRAVLDAGNPARLWEMELSADKKTLDVVNPAFPNIHHLLKRADVGAISDVKMAEEWKKTVDTAPLDCLAIYVEAVRIANTRKTWATWKIQLGPGNELKLSSPPPDGGLDYIEQRLKNGSVGGVGRYAVWASGESVVEAGDIWEEGWKKAIARFAAPRENEVATAEKPRKWTSGTYTTEATLVKVQDGKATLRKTDGKEVAVPIGALSKEDQEYIRSSSFVKVGLASGALVVTSPTWKNDWSAFVAALSSEVAKQDYFVFNVNSAFDGQVVTWTGKVTKIQWPNKDERGKIEVSMKPEKMTLKSSPPTLDEIGLEPGEAEWSTWEGVAVGDSVTFTTTLDKGTLAPACVFAKMSGLGPNAGQVIAWINTKGGLRVKPSK